MVISEPRLGPASRVNQRGTKPRDRGLFPESHTDADKMTMGAVSGRMPGAGLYTPNSREVRRSSARSSATGPSKNDTMTNPATYDVRRFDVIESGSSRLRALEEEITNCEGAYLPKALALREIRDRRLYERGYGAGGFERYCKQRWGYSKSYVNRLIRAAVRAEHLAPIGTELPGSESVSRMLAPFDNDPEKMRGVWLAVINGVGKVNTANAALVGKVVARFSSTHLGNVQPECADNTDLPLPVLGLADLPPVLRALVLEHAANVRAEDHRPPKFVQTDDGAIAFGGTYGNGERLQPEVGRRLIAAGTGGN